MDCRVSVIIPIKDYTPFLVESLKSTVSCLRPEMELILVDDRMDPNCYPAVNAILSHPQVKLEKAKGVGIVNALHTGLSVAKGCYIARMDADDFCMGDRFVLQQAYLDKNPEVGLVSCQVRYGGDSIKNPGFDRFVRQVNSLDTHEKMVRKRFAEAVVIHPSVMFRKELLELGTYQEKNEAGNQVPEDFDLWLRWINNGVRFAKMSEQLLVWNDWEGRLSRNHRAYSKRAFREAAACAFSPSAGKEIWVCGYGRTVERRLTPFRKMGLVITGYLALKRVEREDSLPVRILEEEVENLRGNALILLMVGNLQGKKWIQDFLDRHFFKEEEDYLWMV